MKHRQKRKRSYILMSLCMLLLVITAGKMQVKAENVKKIIRVGYPIQHKLTDIDEYGMRSGYSYDYMMEIAKYQNWEYEYVQVEGTLDEQLSELLEMLKNGEIDLLGSMNYNDALAEMFDYPGSNYGTAYYSLCSLDKNAALNSSNFYLKPQLKVAVYSSKGEKNPKLEQYAQINGINIEQVFCDSTEKQLKLLEDGEVDAMLTKNIALPSDNLVTLASFSPAPFYFATTKGNKDVVNGLNKAQASIQNDNPNLATNMMNKYFSLRPQNLYFSEEQKEYMENAGTLNAVLLCGKPPIQYIDEESGEVKGVSLDVLNFISEQTGLKFEIKATESIEEYEQLITDGWADIVLGASDELLQYGWQKMKITQPYLNTPVMIVLTPEINPQELSGKDLAISVGTHYEGNYVGKEKYFPTSESCMEAVRTGQADYCYSTIYTAQYLISKFNDKNLIYIPQSGEWTVKFAIGIPKQDNDMLVAIFNKTIEYLATKNIMASYLYENAYRPEDITLISYLKSNPLEAGMLLAISLLICILLILVVLRQREKKYRLISRMENERYEQISEISNEYLFEYHILEDRLKLSEKCAEFLNMPRVIEKTGQLRAEKAYMDCILNMENQTQELQIALANEKLIWVRITTKCIKDGVGENIYLVGKLTDIQEERNEKLKLQAKAEKDSLTGAYNMATFKEKADSLYKISVYEKYVLYIIDIDRFKVINDTYGHFIGDIVLENIGRTLLELFTGNDNIVGRLGGDEFIVLSACSESEDRINEMCRFLIKKIGEIDFLGRKETITVSIGTTTLYRNADFGQIYKEADNALYEVKNRGRNGYQMYTGSTDDL